MNYELLNEIFIELDLLDVPELLCVSEDVLNEVCYRQRIEYRGYHPELWDSSIDKIEMGLALECVEYGVFTTPLEWKLYKLVLTPIKEDIELFIHFMTKRIYEQYYISKRFNELYPILSRYKQLLQKEIRGICSLLCECYVRNFPNPQWYPYIGISVPTLSDTVKCSQLLTVNDVDECLRRIPKQPLLILLYEISECECL